MFVRKEGKPSPQTTIEGMITARDKPSSAIWHRASWWQEKVPEPRLERIMCSLCSDDKTLQPERFGEAWSAGTPEGSRQVFNHSDFVFSWFCVMNISWSMRHETWGVRRETWDASHETRVMRHEAWGMRPEELFGGCIEMLFVYLHSAIAWSCLAVLRGCPTQAKIRLQ